MGYLSQAVEINAERWAAVQPWVAALLAERPALPAGEFPLDAAERERVLPWLAYRLYETDVLGTLGAAEGAVRAELSRCAAGLMFAEQELERLLGLAEQAGVDFVAIKGHGLGRTLYSHPACRPTTDFDLLVAPGQIAAMQDLLSAHGYTPFNRFLGKNWLASQTWLFASDGRARHAVDVHWDISNRMYFRQRVDLAALIREAPSVPCGQRLLRVTNPVDSAVIACVHLAAMDPGLPVDLRWLLDIRLLLATLSADESEALVARARQWAAVEACLVFGEAAARLDDSPTVQPALAALRAAASAQRAAEYDRTLRSRRYDLWRYWLRLPAGDKLALFAEGARRGLGR